MKWETKKAWIIAAIGVVLMGLLVFALSGCSASASNGDDYSGERIRTTTVEVNGENVPCVIYVGYGITCNW